MWEYKVDIIGQLDTENFLNTMGKQGWRLHSFFEETEEHYALAIFEREIINPVYLALDPDGKEIIFDPQNRLKTDDKKTE